MLADIVALQALEIVHLSIKRGPTVVVNTLVSINKVALHRARLLLGWVTVCWRVNHLSMYS